MEYWENNWFLIAVILLLTVFAVVSVWRFRKMSGEAQSEAVREWLLMAVTEAERELGGGTGKLKLRYVYDLFVERFPWLAGAVSFAWFSKLVDEALVGMRELLETNEAVKKYVNREGEMA